MEDIDLKIDVENALKAVGGREADVVRLWMSRHTYKDIGLLLGICSERVRQIRWQGLQKLRRKIIDYKINGVMSEVERSYSWWGNSQGNSQGTAKGTGYGKIRFK